MENVFWVIPDRLAGRPGPTNAAWSLPELQAHGFKAVLNLSEFAPNSDDFAALGITCEWMPIPNSYPEVAEAEIACHTVLPRAGVFIAKHLEATQPVLVHCTWGRDRTGSVLTYYLAKYQGLSVDAAIAAVKNVRPKAMTAPGWELMTRRVISHLLEQPSVHIGHHP